MTEERRKKLSSLSIFFPVYNDWGTITTMAAQAITAAEKITDDYEVILVDDGSEEKTQAMPSTMCVSFCSWPMR